MNIYIFRSWWTVRWRQTSSTFCCFCYFIISVKSCVECCMMGRILNTCVCVSRGRVEVFCCEFKWMFFYPKCKSFFVSLWYFVVTQWIWNAKLNLPFQSTQTFGQTKNPWHFTNTSMMCVNVWRPLAWLSRDTPFTPSFIQYKFRFICSTEESLFRSFSVVKSVILVNITCILNINWVSQGRKA